MNIGGILTAIFVPACSILVLLEIKKTNRKTSKTMSDAHFIITIPKFVLIVGMACAVASIVVLLCFTFFSEEIPHTIFYITFGLFFWLGMYLVLKTLKFKVIVKGKEITVYSIFKKTYVFTFDEIISAVRQVKENQAKSERIVLKTKSGKKLIVENTEISYEKFLQKIKMEVKSEYLFGFE